MAFVDVLHAEMPALHAIEIVPAYLLPDSQAFVVENGVLGVEQRFLLKQYVPISHTDPRDLDPPTSLVAILATTENLGALNARKRLCLGGQIAPRDELHVTEVLLGSHLFKHAKSASLWFHRRWLLHTFELTTSLEAEWRIVARAAQSHPKNYYAWGYLRWCCSSMEVSEGFYGEVAQLCRQNLGDVSMWTFLHWLDRPELEEVAVREMAVYPHEAIMAARTTSSAKRAVRNE